MNIYKYVGTVSVCITDVLCIELKTKEEGVCDDQDRPSSLLLVFNNDETKSQTSYLGEEFKKATGCDQ